MGSLHLDESLGQFLDRLNQKAKGDLSATVSMYETGRELGLDKAAASAAAQELMGLGLVEVRSLSGGVGLTAQGVAQTGGTAAKGGGMDEARQKEIAAVLHDLKTQLGAMGLGYKDLGAVMGLADELDKTFEIGEGNEQEVQKGLNKILAILKAAWENGPAGRIQRLVSS